MRRNSAKIMTNGEAARWLGANCADAVTVTPALAGGELATLDGGKPAQCVTLGPFGIKVLRIAGRRQPPGEERDLWP
ncbi:MAG TPA: hypothetical protein VFW50_02410 [Streptosporangiaceae bacterium]|nr:hypothetical protein [Streptosporangiaceae bacterium]